MKILIADDHVIIRAGLIRLLETVPDFQIIAEAESAGQIFEFLSHSHCDLIILDINMPGKNGLEVLKEIKSEKPEIKVLILSIYPEDTYALTAFELGASGYLCKDSSADELIKAIRRIAAGKKYISDSLSDKLASGLDKGDIPHKKLSGREMEILLLIGEGHTPTEIAVELSLSINTVATYRNRILRKMNMTTNSALIHYVVRNNLTK